MGDTNKRARRRVYQSIRGKREKKKKEIERRKMEKKEKEERRKEK